MLLYFLKGSDLQNGDERPYGESAYHVLQIAPPQRTRQATGSVTFDRTLLGFFWMLSTTPWRPQYRR